MVLLHRPVPVMGLVVCLLQCVVVVGGVVAQAPSLPSPCYTIPSFSSIFLGLGTILFSFGGAATFPTIQNDMADRSRFPNSVVIAFIGMLSIKYCWMEDKFSLCCLLTTELEGQSYVSEAVILVCYTSVVFRVVCNYCFDYF